MKTKYFLLVAAAVAFAACSNNESDNQVQNFDNVIRLSSSLGTTRAASDLLETNFDAGTKVKVQVTDKATSGAISYDAVDYTVGVSGALSVEPAQYYPASGSAVKVYAYYPNNASTESNGFAVATDQSDTEAGNNYYKASDLMYASLDPLVKNTTNALTFKHLLSKIQVTLTAGVGFTEDELNTATVVLKAVKYKGTFQPADGSFTAADDTENITITTAAGTAARAAVVVPQDMSDKKLAVTIAGKALEYTFPTSSNFAKGTHNDYNITVAKTGITVTSSIGAWTDGGNNSSQSAAEKTLTY